MFFSKKIILGVLGFILAMGGIANVTSAAESKGLSVTLTGNTTLVPGDVEWVDVAISNSLDTPKVKSATIVLSYDENMFTLKEEDEEDGLLRFDEKLKKYIWRDDTFYIPTRQYDSKDYTIQNPYPEDLVPNDGRREVVLSITANDGHFLDSATGDPFVSFTLMTKESSLNTQSSIQVLTDRTVLTDLEGNAVTDYKTVAADVSVAIPKEIFIVEGISRPNFLPFIFSVNAGQELNALAYFENGDVAYITDLAAWESSNPAVLKPHGTGNVQAVGLGTASLKVTYGSVTGEHEVKVVTAATAAKLNEEHGPYASIIRSDVKPEKIKIIINDKLTHTGLLYNGTVYIPIRSVSEAFHVFIGYDPVKKLPVLFGSPITQSRNFAGTAYVEAKDLPSLLGAKIVKWDNKNKTLYIEYNPKK
ncbi:hypothetical protein [Paenibacillus sp. TC-CSREp1]|uniref:hypothetical protein n=1 Tax=Paenibacillus sp. TC-CSREp1 TaxID=3410089 RepID=UPI003D07A4AD